MSDRNDKGGPTEDRRPERMPGEPTNVYEARIVASATAELRTDLDCVRAAPRTHELPCDGPCVWELVANALDSLADKADEAAELRKQLGEVMDAHLTTLGERNDARIEAAANAREAAELRAERDRQRESLLDEVQRNSQLTGQVRELRAELERTESERKRAVGHVDAVRRALQAAYPGTGIDDLQRIDRLASDRAELERTRTERDGFQADATRRLEKMGVIAATARTEALLEVVAKIRAWNGPGPLLLDAFAREIEALADRRPSPPTSPNENE